MKSLVGTWETERKTFHSWNRNEAEKKEEQQQNLHLVSRPILNYSLGNPHEDEHSSKAGEEQAPETASWIKKEWKEWQDEKIKIRNP